jgi:hypothetical protein
MFVEYIDIVVSCNIYIIQYIDIQDPKNEQIHPKFQMGFRGVIIVEWTFSGRLDTTC